MKSISTTLKMSALGMVCTALALAGSGCASSKVAVTSPSTSTGVALNGKNYRLIKGGAEGQSYGFRFLGAIPLASPHYADARHALYKSVEANEPLAGRSIALANTMEDRSLLYFILFSAPKVTVTADVIEFTDKADVK